MIEAGNILSDHMRSIYFVLFASSNKIIRWECLCKLFSGMDYQLSFGIERKEVVEKGIFTFMVQNDSNVCSVLSFYTLL